MASCTFDSSNRTLTKWKYWSVAIAFVIFGLGSWIMANSLFIEVAALYRTMPEGKEISVYILAALQASNIFPAFYMCFNRQERYISTRVSIIILLIFGAVVCLLLACFWNITATIFGHLHSAVFLVLVFFGGIVSSTTSVVFYPFVASFPPLYTSALATGEGLSGVVAGMFGLLQDSGGEKLRFTISTYFLISAVVFLCSLMAFWFLAYHSVSHVVQRSQYDCEGGEYEYGHTKSPEMLSLIDNTMSKRSQKNEREMDISLPIILSRENTVKGREYNLWHELGQPLVIQLWICALSFGVIPSLMPFFCTHYEYASEVLKWSSVLSMCCDPLARLLTSCWRWYHVKTLNLLVTCIMALMVYECTIPRKPLFSSYTYGGFFPILCNCLFVFCFSYTQTMIYLTLKREVHHNNEYARISYQWAGFLTQVGGALGTIVSFTILHLIPSPMN